REIAVKNVCLGIFDPSSGIFYPARCRRNPDFWGGFPPKPRSVLRNRQGIPRLSGVSSRAHEDGMRENHASLQTLRWRETDSNIGTSHKAPPSGPVGRLRPPAPNGRPPAPARVRSARLPPPSSTPPACTYAVPTDPGAAQAGVGVRGP